MGVPRKGVRRGRTMAVVDAAWQPERVRCAAMSLDLRAAGERDRQGWAVATKWG